MVIKYSLARLTYKMMNKQLDIKNRTYYFFNDLI